MYRALKIIAVIAFIGFVITVSAGSVAYTTIWENTTTITTYSNKSTTTYAGTVSEPTEHTDLGWINVKDFGAVSDGITDSTLAFQEAINKASSNNVQGRVYVPSGVYQVSGVQIDYPITFECQRGTISHSVSTVGDNQNTVIRKIGSNGILFNITQASVTIKNCVLSDDTPHSNTAIAIGTVKLASGLELTSNRIMGFDKGLKIVNMGDSNIMNNGFEGNMRDVIVAPGNSGGTFSFTRFTNNVFFGWVTDSVLFWDNSVVIGVKFIGNSFENLDFARPAISTRDSTNINLNGLQFIGNDFWFGRGLSNYGIVFSSMNNPHISNTVIIGNTFYNASIVRTGDINTRIVGNPGVADV